jgi:hypothetical protein
VLDCDWPENRGLLKLLLPLVGGVRDELRSRMVKTNVAFRRSSKAHHIDLPAAKAEAAPFLAEIIGRVQPRLVLLAGVKLEDFTGRFCEMVEPLGEPIRDPGVKQTVFRSARIQLRGSDTVALAVQVAHASQFGWTYARYEVAERIRGLLSGGSFEPAANDVNTVNLHPEHSPAPPAVIESEPANVRRLATRGGVHGGMNVAAYEELFRKLRFIAFESHKKLQHPDLRFTLYFNRDRSGFVWFAVRAQDFDAYKPTLWDVIPAPQKKDADQRYRTVVPKAGLEEAAFRDLLKK